MRAYQVLNEYGYPASERWGDLCIFDKKDTALEYIDHISVGGLKIIPIKVKQWGKRNKDGSNYPKKDKDHFDMIRTDKFGRTTVKKIERR